MARGSLSFDGSAAPLGMISAAAHPKSANSGWGWPLTASAISVIFGLILVIFSNTSIIGLAEQPRLSKFQERPCSTP
ncbi:hypothetical protein [Tomitella biformata]|uniref:hypothetical protein n=1 Tax=Tomitella biformata TaxID=630403 RepID=UPI0011DDB4B9|nr:hypothetical protein [Tomitella biformata]